MPCAVPSKTHVLFDGIQRRGISRPPHRRARTASLPAIDVIGARRGIDDVADRRRCHRRDAAKRRRTRGSAAEVDQQHAVLARLYGDVRAPADSQ